VPPRPADGNRIAAQLGIISRQRRVREQLLTGKRHLRAPFLTPAGPDPSSAAQNISCKCCTPERQGRTVFCSSEVI
jgi:hypothetical protein